MGHLFFVITFRQHHSKVGWGHKEAEEQRQPALLDLSADGCLCSLSVEMQEAVKGLRAQTCMAAHGVDSCLASRCI